MMGKGRNTKDWSLSHNVCCYQACGGRLRLRRSKGGSLFFECCNEECDGKVLITDDRDIKLWYEKNIKYGRYPKCGPEVNIKDHVTNKQTRRHKR